MPRPEPVDPALYARVFETNPEGALVLEDLIQRFSRPAKLTGGIDAIITTYHNGGARSVVEFIVARINTANGVPDHDDDNG